MNVDHLRSEELEYELGIRGYPVRGTVDEKRKQLRTALRLERDGTAFSQVQILAPEEEIEVCTLKVSELREAADNLDYANAINDSKRIRSRLLHVMGRISRIKDEDLRSRKGQLLVTCGEISDGLDESVLLLEPIQVPNMPTVLPSPQSSSSASASRTTTNQGQGNGSHSSQERNVSLMDVNPQDLQAELCRVVQNGAAPAVTTPVTQTIVTTSAGTHTATSAAQYPTGLYRPCYVPVHQSSNFPPQVPYCGFVPSFNNVSTTQRQQPQYPPSAPQYGTLPSYPQQMPMAATSGQWGSVPPLQNMWGIPPENPAMRAVHHDDQARIFKTVSQWNIRYDGLSGVNNFLESVEEMRLACGFSKTQLASVAVVLFQGVALDWFRANIGPSHSWDDLVVVLKAAFLSAEYEEDLWADIRLRTQGQGERTTTFIAVLQNLFNKLTDTPNERTRIRIIRRNLLPYIQTQLALRDFTTIAELAAACQRVEEAQVRIGRFKPPPTNPNLVTERELMYNPRKCSAALHSVQPVPSVADGTESPHPTSCPIPTRNNSKITCWNCHQTGHIKKDCSGPLARHCFSCGKLGVTKRSCPRCSGNAHPTL